MPRKSKTPEVSLDTPKPAPAVQPEPPRPLGIIQSEVAYLAADFIQCGGWNDTILQEFIFTCMRNAYLRNRNPHDASPCPDWIKRDAAIMTRELVRETESFPQIKYIDGKATNAAPAVMAGFQRHWRGILAERLQTFLEQASLAEVCIMENFMMERESNSALLDFEEAPILYALDIALRGWEGFGKFIRVPERHVKKFQHLLETLQAAEQAESGK